MVETIPETGAYHAAIFAPARTKRIPPSLYWGIMFAVLLHAALAWYIFHQSFSGPVEATPSEGPPITVTMDKPEPPKPQPQPPAPKPDTTIAVHETTVTPLATDETISVTPSDTKVTTGSGIPLTLNPPGGVTEGTGTSVSNEPTYADAKWTRFPDGNALTEYYPQRATDDEMEGVATVECTVLDQSGRVSCVALHETPGNYGFGKATVRMVQDKGRVDTSGGQLKVGSKLRVTVSWKQEG